jgi:hypothetical protein
VTAEFEKRMKTFLHFSIRVIIYNKILFKKRNFGLDPRKWRIIFREEARLEQEDEHGYSRSSSKSSSRIRYRSGEKR